MKKERKKERTFIWYFDKLLIVGTIVAIVAALYFWSKGGTVIMLPSIGVLITFNLVWYALKDFKDWRKIFTKFKLPNDKEYYRMSSDSFVYQVKLYLAVLKEEFLNIGTVFFLLMIKILWNAFTFENFSMSGYMSRSVGLAVIGIITIITFAFPIFAYYITNAIYRLRVVRKRDYIVYHAIVGGANSYHLWINYKDKIYEYKYYNCVGIRAKNVHDTEAMLVFLPDYVYMFPVKRREKEV